MTAISFSTDARARRYNLFAKCFEMGAYLGLWGLVPVKARGKIEQNAIQG
jgi:hypothetical protein|tara:strand:- start:78 stop:227 length:150 start_codon:yes stop_codon:yes gene_type:complete